MKANEEKALDKFYRDIKPYLIPETNKAHIDDCISAYLWDNYEELSNYIKANSKTKVFFYTVVTGDCDTAWILQGCKYVNRLGYLISTKEIKIPEDGLRYW